VERKRLHLIREQLSGDETSQVCQKLEGFQPQHCNILSSLVGQIKRFQLQKGEMIRTWERNPGIAVCFLSIYVVVKKHKKKENFSYCCFS